jgi:hypothetical protein
MMHCIDENRTGRTQFLSMPTSILFPISGEYRKGTGKGNKLASIDLKAANPLFAECSQLLFLLTKLAS